MSVCSEVQQVSIRKGVDPMREGAVTKRRGGAHRERKSKKTTVRLTEGRAQKRKEDKIT